MCKKQTATAKPRRLRWFAQLAGTVVMLSAAGFGGGRSAQAAFRPPAVPLVAFDPYMSIWSETNHLAGHKTVYWTGRVQDLVSIIRVDGTSYTLMGKPAGTADDMHQTSIKVWPLRSVYTFAGHGVAVALTFCTPRLPSSLRDFTQPVTYITWNVHSTDGQSHQVQVYYSTSTGVAVNADTQRVAWSKHAAGELTALKAGSPRQNYFDIAGDPVGLDWGYIYTAAPTSESSNMIGSVSKCVSLFESSGKLGNAVSPRMPRAVRDGEPSEAFAFDLGAVGDKPISRHVLVAYDEVYAIDYFSQAQRPYWRHGGVKPLTMLARAGRNYNQLMRQATDFDHAVMRDAIQAGGRKYAQICALAYRQALAAMGISADSRGLPLVFTKEETSNGDIATVDVFFPASPILLTFCPQLEAASMVPIFDSADTPRWKFPWAPHDLGTYPICRGHYNSGGENMQVEESGNMIILAAAVAHAQGNADFAARYWPMLTSWVNYLRKDGFDPKNQLCTDDFMGFMAHNANLSVKAIEAMGAYAYLCKLRGMTALAADYEARAKRWARRWMAVDADGDHYRMAFNRPNTWSQKYNMVWDDVLDIHAFPQLVKHREIAYYLTKFNRYGLPLDVRTQMTKTDWSIWSATLAQNPAHFKLFMNHIYHWLNQTTDRVPLADYYNTLTGTDGMHARPVMGAAFIKFMATPAMWHKWASRGATFSNDWAPLPPPPIVKVIVPTAQHTPIVWHYTISNPGRGWNQAKFDDSSWAVGPAGFGTIDPGVKPRTRWTTDDIWLRRTFNMPPGHRNHLMLYAYHDEDMQVYINGVFAGGASGYSTQYVPLAISAAGMRALRTGRNEIAVHVHQTTGGQFADVGLAQVLPGK